MMPGDRAAYTPDEWNALLRTDRGETIVGLVTPFQRRPPHLRPPVEDLGERLTAALGALYGQPEEVYVLSAKAFEQGRRKLQSSLPPSLWTTLDDMFWEAFKRQVRGDLWFDVWRQRGPRLLAERKTQELFDAVEYSVWENIARTEWATFRRCLADQAWDGIRERIQRSFEAALCYQIAAAVCDAQQDAPRSDLMRPFLDLYRLGNFPVGRVQEEHYRETFLVLAA
jgi:hypothetical protein